MIERHNGFGWKASHVSENVTRMNVEGGWIYHAFGAAVFVPEFEAGELVATEHVRDDRRLKLREGWFSEFDDKDSTLLHFKISQTGEFGITEDRLARTFTAVHADGSETDHATRLEAHDALIASGSESPFVAVVGVVAKAKAEGGAA